MKSKICHIFKIYIDKIRIYDNTKQQSVKIQITF